MRRSIAILPRIKDDASGGVSVPARTTGFLVEGLEGLGHVPVDDEADVLLVDAHAKGGGGDDDVPAELVGEPFPLAFHAVVRGKTCVVGCGANVVVPKASGKGVAFGAEGDVDDARDGFDAFFTGGYLTVWVWLAGAASVDGLEPREDVGETVVVLIREEANLVVEVRAGCRGGEDLEMGGVKIEGSDNVLPDGQSGSGCQADDGDCGEG